MRIGYNNIFRTIAGSVHNNRMDTPSPSLGLGNTQVHGNYGIVQVYKNVIKQVQPKKVKTLDDIKTQVKGKTVTKLSFPKDNYMGEDYYNVYGE